MAKFPRPRPYFKTYVDPVVRMIILSDIFFWSAWYTVLPLLSVFAIQEIPGATIETATFGFSIYLVSRVIASMLGSVFSAKTTDGRRVFILIYSILVLNLAYILMAFTRSIVTFYIFYIIIGLGFGLANPIRSALFSMHLDKHKETMEWAVLDSLILLGIAACALIGGMVIKQYGFTVLFLLATIFNFMSIFPYLLYKHRYKI